MALLDDGSFLQCLSLFPLSLRQNEPNFALSSLFFFLTIVNMIVTTSTLRSCLHYPRFNTLCLLPCMAYSLAVCSFPFYHRQRVVLSFTTCNLKAGESLRREASSASATHQYLHCTMSPVTTWHFHLIHVKRLVCKLYYLDLFVFLVFLLLHDCKSARHQGRPSL